MTTRKYSSRSQQTTLSSAITSTATTMIVGSASALLGGVTIDSGTTFTVVLDPDTALEEIVDVTAVSSNTLTITRAIDGSSGQVHSAGSVVKHMAIGRDYREPNTHIENIVTAHGLTIADVVTVTDTGRVTSTMIADGTIVDADVNASAAIAKTKISGTALTAADTATVTATILAANSVTTAKIAELAVTNARLAADAVTADKIAADAVGTSEIADSAVTSAKIANGTIVDADINASAAIAATKVAGTAVTQADTGTVTSTMIANDAITNTDINTSAQIAYGKLNLTNTIVNADINASAAIDKTKISGTAITVADTGTVTSTLIADGTIVNGDINTSAAIDKTKISGTAVTVADTGTITSTMIADGTIVNGDINASAAIALSKLATDPLARANHTGTQTSSTISNFDTQVRTSKVTDLSAPTGSFSMNSQKITSLATPTTDTDAATKAYADLMIPLAQKGVANGVAELDADGLVPVHYLPALSITTTQVVSSQAAMLALTAQVGDVAVRTDINKTFILTASPATTLGNWQELLTPTDSVISVDGQTGAVSLSSTYATVANAANKLPLAGGTMSGAIAMGSNKITGLGTPTSTGDAATKDYADTKLPLAGGTLTGSLAMGNYNITGIGTPSAVDHAVNKGYADNKLSLEGGTMAGAIAMGSNKITGLGTPTTDGDAVTKAYADAILVGAPGNLTGPITSIGALTSVASQTGTGSTFVMQNTPTLTTPVLGVATATSINGTAIPSSKTLVATDSTTYVVPGQSGNTGKYLTTDGTTSSWGTVDALPSQTGNTGKYLKTDGTTSSWAAVEALPSQTGNAGKILTTNGTTATWSEPVINPLFMIGGM